MTRRLVRPTQEVPPRSHEHTHTHTHTLSHTHETKEKKRIAIQATHKPYRRVEGIQLRRELARPRQHVRHGRGLARRRPQCSGDAAFCCGGGGVVVVVVVVVIAAGGGGGVVCSTASATGAATACDGGVC